MKKLVAITLLCAHLFNMGGYAVFFQYFIHRSDVQIVKQMYDDKFDNSKLIEIKIPVNMPTVQDWTDFQNIQGQIQFKGSYYNYVRLKMTRDTLSFMCLPNTVKNHLEKAKIAAEKNIADVPLNKKGHDNSVKKADPGYDHVYQAVNCDYARFSTQLKPFINSSSFRLTDPYISSPGKPPNPVC